MVYDKLGNEISVGNQMIFSAGKEVEIYEILKTRTDNRNDAWSQVYVNIGSSKKWKEAVNGIKYEG